MSRWSGYLLKVTQGGWLILSFKLADKVGGLARSTNLIRSMPLENNQHTGHVYELWFDLLICWKEFRVVFVIISGPCPIYTQKSYLWPPAGETMMVMMMILQGDGTYSYNWNQHYNRKSDCEKWLWIWLWTIAVNRIVKHNNQIEKLETIIINLICDIRTEIIGFHCFATNMLKTISYIIIF